MNIDGTLLPANILPASIMDFESQIFVLVFIIVFMSVFTLIFMGIVRAVEWAVKK